MIIKIYGNGWVGKAMKELFPDALVCDSKGFPKDTPVGDVAFICVPTPLQDAKLDVSIVKKVVMDCPERLIVIRSTVMPGTCDNFYNKRVCFMPEYIGETIQHPLLREKERPFLIIGGLEVNRRVVIELMQTVYNANITIRQVTNYEAEVIKLTENRMIAFKVAACQELYSVCEKAGIDYYTIRDAVLGDDPRFNLWWSFIYPDKRGFNSKCIPKDVYGWLAWSESLGYNAKVTKAILEKNEEWINGKD